MAAYLERQANLNALEIGTDTRAPNSSVFKLPKFTVGPFFIDVSWLLFRKFHEGGSTALVLTLKTIVPIYLNSI